jgi:hypothetical protein
MEAIQPCLNAVAREELLKHQDEDVKVLLATCFCEITRITAPEAPYSDDVLRVTYHQECTESTYFHRLYNAYSAFKIFFFILADCVSSDCGYIWWTQQC